MKHIVTFIAMLVVSITIFAQDVIITTDAKKIDAKILEVSKSEIKYKEADNLDGPLFILTTSDISSIIYSNGKVVLYNQTPQVAAEEEQSVVEQTSPQLPQPQNTDNKATILFRSGNSQVVELVDMTNSGVTYYENDERKSIPASQISTVTLTNGQVKTYFDKKETQKASSQNAISSAAPIQNSITQQNNGRIYRDNGQYLRNDIYISSKEVARILEKENSAAYYQWKKADGMLIGGAVCVGIGGGLVLGGLISLISVDAMICVGIECGALVPLGIGLGLTLGASAQYNKAIDIFNSKYDHAAVQLRWSICPNSIGFALAF